MTTAPYLSVDSGQLPDLPSRLYIYVRALQLEGLYPERKWLWPITAQRVLKGWGVVPEKLLPYGSSPWPPVEPHGLDEAAKQYLITYYFRIHDAEECEQSIRDRSGVSVSAPVTHSWFSAAKGHIGVPDLEEPVIGHHNFTLHGYDRKTDRFKFANSWGIDWGEGGHGSLSYDFFAEKVSEAWTHRVVANGPDLRNQPGPEFEHEWGTVLPTGNRIFGCEIFIPEVDENAAWTFVVERHGFLDIEELFVKPAFRCRGFARRLVAFLSELSMREDQPLRLWVPWGDHERDDGRCVGRLCEALHLKLSESGVRWCSHVGLPL